MRVYVDRARWRWPGRTWCHMAADGVEELHAFARRLGLKRAWFQDRRIPHYDLTETKRAEAVLLGAVADDSLGRPELRVKVYPAESQKTGGRGRGPGGRPPGVMPAGAANGGGFVPPFLPASGRPARRTD